MKRLLFLMLTHFVSQSNESLWSEINLANSQPTQDVQPEYPDGFRIILSSFMGNILRVDPVYGDDTGGARNGRPYATINAALDEAISGDAVWIFPGTYNESFTIPAGVSVVGMAQGAGASGSPTGGGVFISRSVTSATDLVTMGENSSLENVTLNLSSASNIQLRGIVFPGTTSATARARNVSINVANTNVSAGSATYGIHSTGNGAPNPTIATLSNSSINVSTSGTQPSRGVLVAGTSTFNINDCTISVNNSSTGSAFGVETLTGTTCNIDNSILSGTGGTGITSDISQTGGSIILGNCKLVNADANALSFSTFTTPSMLVWMRTGTVGTGTFFLYIGTNPTGTTESWTQISVLQPTVLRNFRIEAGTGPGASRVATFNLRRNGTTVLSTTLTGAATSATATGSATFAAGDLISVQVLNTAGGTTLANIRVFVDLY